MTRYRYDKSGRYWDGLPARDIDDEDLDEAQRRTLALAVQAKAYRPESAKPAAPAKTPAAKERASGGSEQAQSGGGRAL